MQKRVLGKTGEMLSILGFGGIIVSQETQNDADDYVAFAIDRGVNYFDVAPSYSNAEDRLGHAIKGKRNSIFLACKAEERTRDGARTQLEQSLKKLGTDHFDLYQFHGVSSMDEAEKILGPDGALETFVKAKEEGLIKYIGFSAHSQEAALKLMDSFDFDTVLFPVNWVNIFNSDFGIKVLDHAEEKGMGRLAIKSMAETLWKDGEKRTYPKAWYRPIDDENLASLALRFTLSKHITAAIPPGDIKHFKWALKTAENFIPMTKAEEDILREKAKGLVPIFK